MPQHILKREEQSALVVGRGIAPYHDATPPKDWMASGAASMRLCSQICVRSFSLSHSPVIRDLRFLEGLHGAQKSVQRCPCLLILEIHHSAQTVSIVLTFRSWLDRGVSRSTFRMCLSEFRANGMSLRALS